MIIHVLPQSGIGYVFPCVLLLGASFPHAHTVGVIFPCREPCSLIAFWDCCLPRVFCWLWCPISFWTTMDFQSVG